MTYKYHEIANVCREKGLLIVHLNVRSLVHKIEEIRYLLTNHDIDCLCLSESWLRNIVTDDLISIPGYQINRWDRPFQDKVRGGGLCVFTKSGLNAEPVELPCKSDDSLEVGCISLYNDHRGTIRCVTIYRPPQGNLVQALKSLDRITTFLSAKSKSEFIIHGDFNVNYSNKSCKWAKELKSWEIKHGLDQMINSPTRVDQKTATLIDLCFSNVKHIVSAGVLTLTISDHLPTFILKKKVKRKKISREFTGRDYSRLNTDQIRANLNALIPDTIENGADPNTIWDKIEASFTEVANQMCPITKFQVKDDKPPYLIGYLSDQMVKRDRLFHRARLKPWDVNLWDKAKNLKYKIRAQIKQSKRDYVRQTLEKSKGNCKKYWQTISTLIKPRADKHLTGVICPETNSKLSGIAAADLINAYFCNIGESLANQIPSEQHSFQPVVTDCKLVWSDRIKQSEVLSLIQKLDTKKSSGMPELGSRILKECLLSITPFFTDYLNYCVTCGNFPVSWKKAVIVPIPKGAKKPTLSNIRPISLLPYPGKVFEEIIHKRLYNYLEYNRLICKEQSGFRKNFSTSDPILDLVTETCTAFNEGKGLICIYIDMAKAFNSLNCCLLVKKISALGISGNVLKLFRDYLTARQQTTNLGGLLSKPGTINYRVPQGSILGPTLFNIYMNDLPTIFKTVAVKMYADDTVLFKSIDLASNIESQMMLINDDLKQLELWCRANKLTINVEKSKCMLFVAPLSRFKNYDTATLPDLCLNGARLTYVNTYRYLGIELDRHLKMEAHLKNIIQKVRPIIYKFSKIRYLIDKPTSILMYKTYVLPNLETGLYLLDNYYKNQVEKLQKIQNRCLRICSKRDSRSSAQPLHIAAKLLPLRYRRECYLLNILIRKLLKDDGTFTIVVGNSNRARCGSQVAVTFPKSETFKKSVAFETPSLWNKLPRSLKENPLPWVFKRNIKKYYIEKFVEEYGV